MTALARDIEELENRILEEMEEMRSVSADLQIVPRMGDRNTLGNMGTLLPGAVSSTEDFGRDTGSIAEHLANLSPVMRMAIVRSRIMMRAEKEEEREARLDSGLVEAATDEQREEQVGRPIVRIANFGNAADFRPSWGLFNSVVIWPWHPVVR